MPPLLPLLLPPLLLPLEPVKELPPHALSAIAAATVAATNTNLCMSHLQIGTNRFSYRSVNVDAFANDLRGNEDQQLILVIGLRLFPEEGTQYGDVAQQRNLG